MLPIFFLALSSCIAFLFLPSFLYLSLFSLAFLYLFSNFLCLIFLATYGYTYIHTHIPVTDHHNSTCSSLTDILRWSIILVLESLQLQRDSSCMTTEHRVRCINSRRTHSLKYHKHLIIVNIPLTTYFNTSETVIKIRAHDCDVTTSNPKGLLIVHQLLMSLPGPEISL